jgi:PhnB protein
MHSQLTTDTGLTIMAADTTEEAYNGSISLSGDDEATIRGYWDKLVDGGEVGEPLVQAPWGDTFGMLRDKFGIHWMFNIAGQPQG